ncbi:adenosine nucleotide hydrolase [Deinococcus sp. KSM4-11]|uniref:Dph6-related ATP pyrophosphatase n=1 Tax=Deinococcus sp. KSM4-11 TaxID=2568654 RepID=UPI0010A58DF5|nr:adenosine nucleotide hydrolase [Deinococcus sp. KSM4-11]THF84784.1 adenosine nucleotide hydrolase [Deinococcus sp. KSM4-11]
MTGLDTPFITSWSGGKDSALAFHRIRRAGGRPTAILNVLDETGERTRSHGLRPEVVQAQAAALGVPLWTANASWAAYEPKFTALLARAAGAGATRAVFGDIDLQAHRDWEEQVCAAAGITAALPLWLEPRRTLVDELLGLGFRARIVAVREDALPTAFLGRELDAALVGEIEAHGADACGENGEYHTVLVDGPDFTHPLDLVPGPRGIHHTGEGSLRVATLDLVLK